MKRKLTIVLVILILILTGCRPLQRPNERGQLETNQSAIFDMARIEYCRINSDNTDVKSGFGNAFESIGTLNQNDVVRVLDQIGDWYAVQLDNNKIGAIQTYLAQPVVRDDDTITPSPDQQTPQLRPDENIIGVPRLDQGDTQRDVTPRTDQATPPRTDLDAPAPPREDTRIGQEGGVRDGGQLPPSTLDPVRPEGTRTPETGQEPPTQTPEQRQQPRQTEGPTRDLTDQEQQMVDLVNRERRQNNLPELQVDFELTRVARIKSQDMVDHNYFSHYSPTYGSPFEMLDSFGIKYLHAGENLAGNNNVQNAHTALMNSSGHRKNILNPNFTHIGIGVRPSNRYGYIYTQLFISKPR